MTRLTLPDPAKIKATNFRLQRVQAVNPLRGGNHQAVDLGEPVWMCDISTTPLSREQGGSYKWLIAKLRGALRTLMLWDVSRPRPLVYHDEPTSVVLASSDEDCSAEWILASAGETIPSWGFPRLTATDREDSTLSLDRLRPGFTISEGDYGAWDDGPTRRLHIMGEALVDADGEVTVEVEPAPPSTLVATLPVAFEMEKPTGEFVVMQADAPYSAPVTHEVTLQAAQVFRRS